ncbi:hypothetical protein D3C87_1287240 [compost metagenome]
MEPVILPLKNPKSSPTLISSVDSHFKFLLGNLAGMTPWYMMPPNTALPFAVSVLMVA